MDYLTTPKSNAKRIVTISFISLVLGLSMVTTYVPNEFLNLVGLFITAYYIFRHTLNKNDTFSFVMVMYFCSLFPYLSMKGGGFNLVGFVVVLLYFFKNKIIPGEILVKDKCFKLLFLLFIISSIFGWCTNYTGQGLDIIYSIATFLGIISLLWVASRLIITPERITVFLQVNMVLIIYSTVASLNKYLRLVTINTPLLPISGFDNVDYFEGGGIIGSSPLYGEHSLFLAILFTVFLVLASNQYKITRNQLMLFLIIAVLNIFMSISRSVFLLTISGIIVVLILQFRINSIGIAKQFKQVLVVAAIGISTLFIINISGLGYVFDRVEEISEKNQNAGGISLDRIIDGSAFNRETAFEEGYKRYHSKDSWWIGYGWGLSNNNRDAFYVDTTIARGSAHSQIFAVLFILGWLGFIAYFGFIILLIRRSYRLTGNTNYMIHNRIFGYFFMIVFLLFLFNEIKADSISNPSYFAVTLILVGIGYSNVNSAKYLRSE